MREPFVPFMQNNLEARSVLIACGLPASYKTETTEVIADLLGYTILRSDLIRLEVLKNEDIFDEKVAANFQKRTLVYDEMFRRAHELASQGQGIILDATFVTQSLRRRAAEVAAAAGMGLVIQQTQCPREVSLRRISKRTKENYESNALTEQAYDNNVKKFEPVDLDDLLGIHPSTPFMHLLVDTTSDLTEEWLVIDRQRRP
ncbi:AAA family ATPase [Desulfatiglans anilini]|uniref:AAA family ATPase n=1 Tax=Desulfatiglans anilini TaxID=90728 RepID=UPI0004296CE1|nr:ATP-binding protein [Desulfatiglans anilini]